jgi:hypothetical protein
MNSVHLIGRLPTDLEVADRCAAQAVCWVPIPLSAQ